MAVKTVDALPALVTYEEAIAQGRIKFFTGIPCGRGHLSERYVRLKACVECAKMYTKKPATYKKNQERKARKKRELQESLAGGPKPKICDVCHRERPIVFDHCHNSKRFRGWLCDQCNVALGMAGESPTLLRKLAVYLEERANGPPDGKEEECLALERLCWRKSFVPDPGYKSRAERASKSFPIRQSRIKGANSCQGAS